MKNLMIIACSLVILVTTWEVDAGIVTFEDVHGLVGDHDVLPGPSQFTVGNLDDLVSFKSPNGTYNRGEETAFGMTMGDYMGFWLNDSEDDGGIQIKFAQPIHAASIFLGQYNVDIPADFLITVKATDGSWWVEYLTFPVNDVANEMAWRWYCDLRTFDVGFDQIDITFHEGSSTHLYLDQLRFGDDALIPEPTALLIWSMLAGLGMISRRRR